MIHFDTKIWKRRSISNDSNTSWKCGYCGVGSLQSQTNIPKSSKFAIRAKCTDSNCNKTYYIIGKVVPVAKGIEVGSQYLRIDDYRLYPTHFYPELVMFEMPMTLSKEIKSIILKSFNHFWYDLDACANKIRQAIELIVGEKQGTGANLHQQINSLRDQLGDKLTNTILALKWIGNDGSHANRPFERDEILDTYSLLVDVLNQLYPNESEDERRKNLVDMINERKGMKNI